jgi:hypothetical protein
MILDEINKMCYMCNCGFKNNRQDIVKIKDELYYVKKPEKYNCNRCNTMLTKQCNGYNNSYITSFGTHTYWCSTCFNFISEYDITKCQGAIYYKIHKFNVCFPNLKPEYVGRVLIPQMIEGLQNINESLFVSCPT